LGSGVFSTHNEAEAFSPEGLKHAIEINQILGSPTICCVRGLEARSSNPAANKDGPLTFERMGLDTWEKITPVLQQTAEHLRPLDMVCTFHNHGVEFIPVKGVKPIDILAQAKDVAFHIDVNVCRSAGADPVAFIKQYPGGSIRCCSQTDRATPAGTLRSSDTARPPGRMFLPPRKTKAELNIISWRKPGGGLPPMQAVQKELEQYKLIHG